MNCSNLYLTTFYGVKWLVLENMFGNINNIILISIQIYFNWLVDPIIWKINHLVIGFYYQMKSTAGSE